MLDSIENMLIDEPTEKNDANDPMLPMDSTEPTLPIDSTEPVDPIDRMESREAIDHLPRRAGKVPSELVVGAGAAGVVLDMTKA